MSDARRGPDTADRELRDALLTADEHQRTWQRGDIVQPDERRLIVLADEVRRLSTMLRQTELSNGRPTAPQRST